jgi:hypothetical protein
MINWGELAGNVSWILGCAIALACFSYALWQASVSREKVRSQWQKPPLQKALYLAGVLFCTGLAGSSSSLWEIILWAVLAGLFFVQLIVSLIRRDSPANIPPA